MRLKREAIEQFRNRDAMEPIRAVGRHDRWVGDPAGMWPHSHPDCLEVFYVERGEIEWWTGPDVFELRPTDVLVSLPHESHGTVDSALSPCSFLWAHLDDRLLTDELRAAQELPGFRGIHRSSPEVGDLLDRLLAEHRRRDRLSPDACRSLVTLLITSLARSSDRGRESEVGELVRNAGEILASEEGESLTVADVAAMLSVSSVWLTKMFKREVGRSPAAWQRAQRIARAKRVLADGTEPIGEIAVQLGFPSSQYFAAAFRRETGRTPTQYRKLHPAARRAGGSSRS